MDSKTRMIDVSSKDDTVRVAVACGEIRMKPETIRLIQEKGLIKGDPVSVARIAGIMGAKQTPYIIPLCHPLNITSAQIEVEVLKEWLEITATVSSVGKTGVEMEALTAVSVSALAIYDICKTVDKEMVIGNIRLLEKEGGRSGHFKRAGSH